MMTKPQSHHHVDEDLPPNQPGSPPVEPDEGQIPPSGIPVDPEFERVKPPEE